MRNNHTFAQAQAATEHFEDLPWADRLGVHPFVYKGSNCSQKRRRLCYHRQPIGGDGGNIDGGSEATAFDAREWEQDVESLVLLTGTIPYLRRIGKEEAEGWGDNHPLEKSKGDADNMLCRFVVKNGDVKLEADASILLRRHSGLTGIRCNVFRRLVDVDLK